MAPPMKDYTSCMPRPPTRERDRPVTREYADPALMVPSRTSSLHSRITQPIPSNMATRSTQRTPKTLTHAYMVCGLGREPSQWVKAPPPAQGRIGHMKNAVGQFWLPEILGSSPRLEQDNEIARSLHGAMRACFPHDVEVCTGRNQPHCVHHSFVLQQDSSHTLYGIALRVWSRADENRAETIKDLRRRNESDYYESSEETYWIPYCLSFLSRYPLYDLLGDYLRGMWIHWNKATNLFHAEEVSRILSFPAPRLNDLVRIDMKDYALCYQFPSSPTGFQNFSMWPLFNCLSIPNIVGVVEAAVSANRRIIFVSHYPAMLTVASETIRQCVRVYEWSGLYMPICHARHIKELVQEPGPYMLGVTAECRTLFNAPSDALVIDLDRNYVMTSTPPTVLAPNQRSKMISRLTNALNGDVIPAGVPQHLRSAYGGGKLVPAGQIIVMRGEVESVEEPIWWHQDNIMSVMDHVCEKLGRNTGVKAIFGSSTKKPLTTKVSLRHLNEIIRERNQYSRDAMEAWQDFINLKSRMDSELSKVTKRNGFLVDELESWKQQFLKFQAFAEQLTKETQDLKVKIENHKREHRRLTLCIDQQKDDAAKMSKRLTGTEKQRDDAFEALVLQQEIAEELERERKRVKKEMTALAHTNKTIVRQRDESQRVVIHLRALIDGQSHHMQHIVRSLNKAPELSEYAGHESISDLPEENDEVSSLNGSESSRHIPSPSPRMTVRRSVSRMSRRSSGVGQYSTPEMDSRFYTPSGSGHALGKGSSRHSVADLADRHLRERTDAIADIIRNISEQCAAAVEGLQLAHDADADMLDPGASHNIDPALVDSHPNNRHSEDKELMYSTKRSSQMSVPDESLETDSGHGGSVSGALSPSHESVRDPRSSLSTGLSTPDLVGGRSPPGQHSRTSMASVNAAIGQSLPRSSTAMSVSSNSTALTLQDRDSVQMQNQAYGARMLVGGKRGSALDERHKIRVVDEADDDEEGLDEDNGVLHSVNESRDSGHGLVKGKENEVGVLSEIPSAIQA